MYVCVSFNERERETVTALYGHDFTLCIPIIEFYVSKKFTLVERVVLGSKLILSRIP